MISLTAEYSLRAAVFLATHFGHFIGRSAIAEETRVPVEYLLKVLNGLDAAGIVESKRGPNGGYRLCKDPSRITALDVVTAVDTIPRIERCPLGIEGHTTLCPLHRLLDNAAKSIEQAFRSVTLAELTRSRRSGDDCQFPKLTE